MGVTKLAAHQFFCNYFIVFDYKVKICGVLKSGTIDNLTFTVTALSLLLFILHMSSRQSCMVRPLESNQFAQNNNFLSTK